MTTDLTGQVAVITGGNSGIGKETAVELAGMGAHVVIAARNPDKARAAVKEVQARAGAGDRVDTLPIDLASFASVHAFAKTFADRYDRLDILVNNAGLVLQERVVTEDGHETQFQVNHLGHFLLTNLVQEQLRASAPARVVNVASSAHKSVRNGLDFDDLDWSQRRYSSYAVYSASKLANILFTRELARRWDSNTVTANAVHPGFVATNWGREGDLGWLWNVGMTLARPFAVSNAKGAETSVYVASSPDVEGITGQYFIKGRVNAPSTFALDDAAAERLWEISEQMVAR